MYVSLKVAAGRATLEEAEDFAAFKVIADGTDRVALARTLQGIGRLDDDGDHAFIDPAGLRALAGPLGSDPGWNERLEEMTAYAASRGWIERGTGAIQAHVEAAGT